MRPAFRLALGVAAAVMAGGLAGCIFGEKYAGSSEVGNPSKGVVVAGFVYEKEEYRSAGAVVRLIPRDFAPDSSGDPGSRAYRDTTDEEGGFVFKHVEPGWYNLEARHKSNGTRLLLRDLEVKEGEPGDSMAVKLDRFLAPPSALRIAVTDSLLAQDGFFYFQGTSDVTQQGLRPLADGTILFDSLPSGSLPALYYARAGKPDSRHLVSEGAQLHAKDTVALNPYSTWSQYRRVHLNTSATGSNVPGTALNYPLLIRLTGSHVDFSLIDSGGKDLRFSKPDGTPLPYEIESWDRESQKAAIWVRLDTLYGNRANQILFMHFGKAGAADASNGPAVFDTGDGWAGVWHFNQEIIDSTVRFRDASGYGNDAGAKGTWSALNQIPGIGANGLQFDGTDQAIIGSRAFPALQTFTLSMMFRTTTHSGGKLIGFGSSDTGSSLHRDRQIWMDNQGKIRFGSGNYDTLISDSSYNNAAWHHVAAVLSPKGQSLYVDGKLVAQNPNAGPAQEFPGYWHIGYDFMYDAWGGLPAKLHFQGQVDEVRVNRTALGPEWIQHAYANQRTDANLIHFSQ